MILKSIKEIACALKCKEEPNGLENRWIIENAHHDLLIISETLRRMSEEMLVSNISNQEAKQPEKQ